MPFIHYNAKNILFIHIPKTGGTTTEHWLAGIAPLTLRTVGLPTVLKCTPQHMTYTDIRTLFGEDYFDYAFAIVRNPYTRLASEYRMQHILGKKGFWAGFETFPAWVDSISQQYRTNPWCLDNHIRPQWQFISANVRVFRFEDGMEDILRKVADATGLPCPEFPLDVHTSSENFDGELIWDTREIETVRSLYQRDFEIFGYDINAVPAAN